MCLVMSLHSPEQPCGGTTFPETPNPETVNTMSFPSVQISFSFTAPRSTVTLTNFGSVCNHEIELKVKSS